MNTFWLLYKAEIKLSFREMSSVIFGLILPAVLMALMGMFAYSNEELNLSFAAIATIGLCATGLMSLPLSLSSYREQKVLKRYKVTPISPMILLFAHVSYCFSLSISSMLMVFAVAKFGYGMNFIGSPLKFIAGYLLVMAAIHSIGLIIASLSPSEKTTGAISSALYFPMFLLSGATIPFEIMPSFLQSIVKIFPLTHGIELLKGIALNQLANLTFSLTVLILTAIVCLIISIKFFKWE
ncbi:ABC transporter permease [Cytobacillus horneckiae]|uniref:Transport permease protein n=1 Tax=Cytobacillus horneckiae TaxID=549687 RepID=A0A2N0ZMQ0_9BACI|nr:ABC transporter permease [Cytobacillus horneckiae]MEC1159105.1 ABC transporter permease [Cytobacillus horneckiae]MED2938797.1 ABC transporter permease [Cytobacillus horneckiae]PKG30788.1 ABC transporter permease [Cytobacillus horneckiae]